MEEKFGSREELIEEVKLLRKKTKENEVEPEEETATEFADFFNSMLESTGMDINKIQTDYLGSSINNLPNPAYYKDSNGVYAICNKFFEEFIGKTSDEIIGRTIFDLVPAEAAQKEKDKDREALRGEGLVNYETKFTISDGTEKEIVESKSLIKNLDGSVSGIVGVITDITEKRKIERALVESEQKLREAVATKDKFFSIITHDLKNPHAVLLGFTEMLLEDFDEFTDDEKKGYINDLHESAKRSSKLLDNLSKWAKSQMGRLEFEPEELILKDEIAKTKELFNKELGQKNISFETSVGEDVKVVADRMTLETILENLISNGIKFNKENGSIKIDANDSGKMVEISIADTGVGLTEKDVEKLFRIDVHAVEIGKAKEPGTGIGLILCNEFVKRNGGVIKAEGEIDKGSRFTFTLPKKLSDYV